MGFHDNFVSSYLLTPVGTVQRAFAPWSLEDTVNSGVEVNRKQVQVLRENLTSAFKAGISRLEQTQSESARLLQKELQYQADSIIGSIQQGAEDVIGALQKGCDYLGGELCEVRWAIERQTQVSQQILQVLMTALDNTSRQYWEQGVKCYDTGEYEIARERFSRALDANRTNYFAYQYLGFIAVHNEDEQEAVKNFDLARKFSENGYYRALALSFLARTHNATGSLSRAIQSSIAATQAAPDHANFWYEAAVYAVRDTNIEEALRCLRQAISIDRMYWSVALSDASLDPIRGQVEGLLEKMREEQRVLARHSIDALADTLELLSGMQITTEFEDCRKELGNFEATYRTGAVFAYRELLEPANNARKQAVKIAVMVLDKRAKENRSSLEGVELQVKNIQWEIDSRTRSAESKASDYRKTRSARTLVGTFSIVAVVMFVLSLLVSTQLGYHYYVNDVDVLALGVGGMVSILAGLAAVAFMIIPLRSQLAEIAGLKLEAGRAQKEGAMRVAREKQALDVALEELKRNKEKCSLVL